MANMNSLLLPTEMTEITTIKTIIRVKIRTLTASRWVRIANEILMFFRSQKKTSAEVSISETIDTDKDGNPLTYIDVISIDDTIAEDLDFKMQSEKALRLVTTELLPREKEIIIMRYGLGNDPPRTQREVAKLLNISRSYVSRIEKKALSILRKHFGDTSPSYLSEKE